MMELISRKALLEDLQAYRDQLYEEEKTKYETGFRRGIAYAKEFVKTAPTIEVPRWIPVTERLPTWADGNKYGGILAVRRGHELSDFYHCNDVKENPDEFTHWMPLPKLLKDGDSE